MALTMEERNESGVTILKPEGRIDASSMQAFSGQIQQAIDSGCTKILIDFGATEYMSSAGVRAIIDGMKKVETIKGSFAVCSPNENLKELFDVIRLDQVVKIYKDDFEALDKMI